MSHLNPTASLNPCRNYIRATTARILHPKSGGDAEKMAESRWGWVPQVKAAVTDYSTGDTRPGKEATEFFDRVFEQSIFGQIQGWRRVNFNQNLMKATGASGSYWTSEFDPAPVSKLLLDASSLPRLKCAGLAVFTKEALEATGEVAEAAIERDVLDAAVGLANSSFLDPSNAGTAGESPASVCNGLTPVTSTADPSADIRSLITAFAGDLSKAYFVSDPTTLTKLATARDSGGAYLFPDVGPRGGQILGIPAVSTRKAPSGGSSILAIIDPSGIALAMDEATLSYSEGANILMSDDPVNDVSPDSVNLFQNDLVAAKIVLSANWEEQRTGSVAFIEGDSW